MYLFAGLGNFGNEYDGTPHNAGFMFMDRFTEFLGFDALFQVGEWEFDKYLHADRRIIKVGPEPKHIGIKPRTLMNLSGLAVKATLDKYELNASKSLVLIYDDLDIPLGKYKIARGKHPKEHNGVKDVIFRTGSIDFMSVRIGIEDRGADSRIPGEDYVLQKFNKEQLQTLDESIVECVKELRSVLEI